MSAQVTIRLFASLKEAAGWQERTVPLGDAVTATDLWSALARDVPGLARWPRPPLVAINREWCKVESPVAAGDEVAFLPPIAGG